MIYGTLRPCGVVVCDDIWDTEGCSVTYGTLWTVVFGFYDIWDTAIWNTMDKGVVVYYDIWDTTDTDDIWDTMDKV